MPIEITNKLTENERKKGKVATVPRHKLPSYCQRTTPLPPYTSAGPFVPQEIFRNVCRSGCRRQSSPNTCAARSAAENVCKQQRILVLLSSGSCHWIWVMHMSHPCTLLFSDQNQTDTDSSVYSNNDSIAVNIS